MTELLQTNRMQAVALMFESTLHCHQRGIKLDEPKQNQSLEKVFKDTNYNIKS